MAPDHMAQTKPKVPKKEGNLGGGESIYTAGPHPNQPPQHTVPLGQSLGGSTVPSLLDSSLEKTILGFFFEIRCWVFGCRRVVRRGSGVTKSLSESADTGCWCRLETSEGGGMSPQKGPST